MRARKSKLESGSVGHGGPIHPGLYVREKVLKPTGMTVTQAAKVIGVSRPGVSNFLNGKVTATPEMAKRIERAFKIPAQELLDMQAAYDAARAGSVAPANSMRYVPPFLQIRAGDIEAWVNRISARSRLAVFLRTLVHSTGVGLTKVEFPGNDNAERPGWDGFVEASEGTAWIPQGVSGWEFGTNQDPESKADKDFSKSVRALDKADRLKTTFIFVTPRRWPGKKNWEAEARETGSWKDVRVYDVDNIEQWLEQSLSGQVWFSNETARPSDGVRSLDKSWVDWAEVTSPALVGTLFGPVVEVARRMVSSRLSKVPERPITIAADSVEEGLGFLAYLFRGEGNEALTPFRDRLIVFDHPGVLPHLLLGAPGFIPVVYRREVEHELGAVSTKIHCFVISPRNAPNLDADFILEPVDSANFRKGLEEIGKNRDEINQLENRSGRSLTVLRRQMSTVPAIKTPKWVTNQAISEVLIPFMLVGAWNHKNQADQQALGLLAGRPYEDLERDCQKLTQLNDAPVWSVGSYRGVVSKIDLLFAIANSVTNKDLEDYFQVARIVLGEDDPRLDLDEADRIFASIRGKVREFSSEFRKGISETLVLLAVNGNRLFQVRLGIDVEGRVSQVINELLSDPLTTRRLEANSRDLRTYAEAAPETFLSILERDLRTENPAVSGLIRPVDAGVFGDSPSRAGLLWALEGLAWNPATFQRAVFILAQLAQVPISDNWSNKPINSLKSIFRCWMPQTAADHSLRVEVMKQLEKHFPKVAWKICISQISYNHQTGMYNHKPQWRADGYGFGEPFKTYGPIMQFKCEMMEMALHWNEHGLDTLSDLVDAIGGLGAEYRNRVWSLIKSWAHDKATDIEKAKLREKVRVATLSRRAVRRENKKGRSNPSRTASEAFEALEPSDLFNRYAWLFEQVWVEESVEESDGDEVDYKKREERITKLRTDALGQIFSEFGLNGILTLVGRSEIAPQIGWICAEKLLPEDLLGQLLHDALFIQGIADIPARNVGLVKGILRALPADKRDKIIKQVCKDMVEDDIAKILMFAPFNRDTWGHLDELGQEAQKKYWDCVSADFYVPENDVCDAIDRFRKAGRPKAAFGCACIQLEKIDVRVLYELLYEIAYSKKNESEGYPLDQYHLVKAIKRIGASAELTLDEKAGIEFVYLELLTGPERRHSESHFPNLERRIETQPSLFVQMVTWLYKRRDEGIDPPEFQIPLENRKQLAERAYLLLTHMSRIPGHDDLGELKTERLMEWIIFVRNTCASVGREKVGDHSIGELLSSASTGKDGIWPCEEVRDALQMVRSDEVIYGMRLGLYNSRGFHFRGKGGDQERELADKYRKWAEALRTTHPYVSAELLMKMVKGYEEEASFQDTEARVRMRLE